MEEMIKILVNEKEHEVPKDITLIQALEHAGYEIPRFCYHDRLKIAGNCRMCLVELVGGPPKPVASCATSVAEGMNIRLDSQMVKNAREGVMEFMLINHPLDCPICDQGGECDLQDQAIYYGKAESAYKEEKRAVSSKNFGPLIKTMMTRCIHCTRCIRFAEDVAGVPEIGTIGRGEDMLVSTYVEKTITSEMSGNMIDICPVGALTSKPFAFKARPWELTKTESIDVHDACGSNIRVDSRRKEVVRILPLLNEDINEEWISDKTRFAYDGLLRQRIDRPYLKKNKKFEEISWDEVLNIIVENMKEISSKSGRIAALAGDLADTESIYLLKKIMQAIGSDDYDSRPSGSNMQITNRSDYIFNSTINGIEDADFCLLVNVNPRKEAAILNSRILKAVNNNGLEVAYLGESIELNYNFEDLGDKPACLEKILAGDHNISEKLKKAKKPMIIVGEALYTRQDANIILSYLEEIALKYGVIRNKQSHINILHNAAARVGALDVGFIPSKKGLDTAEILNFGKRGDLDLIFLLGYDNENISDVKNAIKIYIGSHGDVGAKNADIILPAAAYTEKDALYVNTEGRVQYTKKAVVAPGEAREDWIILNDILGLLTNNKFTSKQNLHKKIFDECPNLLKVNSEDFVSKNKKNNGQFNNKTLTHLIKNFYMTNPITRASVTMAKCSKELTIEEENV